MQGSQPGTCTQGVGPSHTHILARSRAWGRVGLFPGSSPGNRLPETAHPGMKKNTPNPQACLSVEIHTGRSVFAGAWSHMSVCTPRATHLGTHWWGHSQARDYAHTRPTSRRKDCRHTVLKGAWWPLGSGPRGICPFSSLGLRHGAPTYTVPMATALPSPRPSVIGQGEKCGTLTSLPPSSIWGMEGVC